MRMATFAKLAVAMSASVVGVMGAAPVVASATPTTTLVPCTGQGALVAAINAANAAGGGVINLTPGCHYALKSVDNGENGLPVVTSRIVVNGNGATINGTHRVRVFEVDGPGGNLSLVAATIRGGSADIGGGIENVGGTVTLTFSQVTRNTASQAGGGIASATFDPSSVANLTLNLSRVTDNRQTLAPKKHGLGGGGIVNVLGRVTTNFSQVDGNTAMGFVGGGIANGDYMNFSGTTSFLTVNASQVNGNTAPNAGGGGIQNLLGTVSVNFSQVDGNSSLNGGGISSGNGMGGGTPCSATVTTNWSQVNGNTATAPAPSGPGSGPPIAAAGIANGCTAVLNSTQVDGNTAANTSGAGIVNHGVMTLNGSEANNNTAAGHGVLASGGGILNGNAGVPNSGVLTLNNSRVNNNTAGGNGGGIANGLALGKMSLPGGPVTLNHSQVIGNVAQAGGGIFNVGGATVTLSASTVIENHPDNCEPAGTIAGCVG